MEEKIQELIELTKENNRMLKEIIKYINYTIQHADTENMNDFGMNVIANLLSNRISNI